MLKNSSIFEFYNANLKGYIDYFLFADEGWERRGKKKRNISYFS